MTNWEEWHSIELEAFPKLRKLQISECPKLTRGLPCQLLSLEVLEIRGCPLLASSIPRCPKLQDVVAEAMALFKEQELPPSLQRLQISGSQMLELVEAMALFKSFHLEDLSLRYCSNVVSLECDVSPKSLSIRISCETLTSFPVEIFPYLSSLRIENSDNLISVLASNVAPQNLRKIFISNCKNMKLLSNDTESLLPNLKELIIDECPEIDPFPEGFLPSSLRTLKIHSCDKLLARYREWYLPSISYLAIWDEHGIFNCFPEGCSLPSTVTTLAFYRFSSLETLNCEGLEHLTFPTFQPFIYLAS